MPKDSRTAGRQSRWTSPIGNRLSKSAGYSGGSLALRKPPFSKDFVMSEQHGEEQPHPEPPRSRSFAQAIVLAVPPTITVLAITAVPQYSAHAHLLFAPLAASAFLIYLSPLGRANHVRVVVGAQLFAAVIGTIAAIAVHPGFVAETIAMLVTVTLLIAGDTLHAPAVSTSLIFADLPANDNHAGFFAIAVALLAVLCYAQRYAHVALRRRPHHVEREP